MLFTAKQADDGAHVLSVEKGRDQEGATKRTFRMTQFMVAILRSDLTKGPGDTNFHR